MQAVAPLRIYRVNQKMYFSVKRKNKTMLPLLKILPFLSQDFSSLNFDILPFIFRFNFAELCNF